MAPADHTADSPLDRRVKSHIQLVANRAALRRAMAAGCTGEQPGSWSVAVQEGAVPMHKEIMDAIRQMSVADLIDLVRALESEFENRGAGGASLAVVRSEPTLSLRDFEADKIEIIKAAQEMTDLGLREARFATRSHDADGETDADGSGTAGVPAKPKTPPPTGAGSGELPLRRHPRWVA